MRAAHGSTLEATPATWLAWDYDVSRDGRPVASIRVARIREAGGFDIDGVVYEIGREPGWGRFVLAGDGEVIAFATKPSPFLRWFDVTCDERLLTLRAVSPLTRRFVVLDGDSAVGDLRPTGFLSRSVLADLPRGMPVATQIFLVWLVLIMWRRQAK